MKIKFIRKIAKGSSNGQLVITIPESLRPLIEHGEKYLISLSKVKGGEINGSSIQ